MSILQFFKPKKKIPTIAEIAEINHAEYQKMLGGLGWDTLGSKPELILVYTDSKGNNYYIARNTWQGISRDRLAALERANLAMEYRMSRENIMEREAEKMREIQKAQRGDLAALQNAYKLSWETFEIMKAAPSDQILMEYAVHILYTDGENPEILDPEILKMKRDRAENDTGLRAFFLNMAHSAVNSSLPTLPHDGQNSTVEEEKQEGKKASQNRIANFIQQSKPKKN
jgi:hypothetical protein